mmetsp:Transcript_125/g.316  ORF Transcript_125/g.316 Transcript_125/m.316 type:complete len:83 (-) Transcript_125:192-440(-)
MDRGTTALSRGIDGMKQILVELDVSENLDGEWRVSQGGRAAVLDSCRALEQSSKNVSRVQVRHKKYDWGCHDITANARKNSV